MTEVDALKALSRHAIAGLEAYASNRLGTLHRQLERADGMEVARLQGHVAELRKLLAYVEEVKK